MQDFLLFFSELIWGSFIIYVLLGVGIWFTFTTRFVQFRTVPALWQALTTRVHSTREGISPIQAVCLSLAGRAGSGNLPGVALALVAGGPGALFWMWIAGMVSMASAFAEGTLAQLFKTRDSEGRFRGGPAWYISYGLGLRGLGAIFALLLIVTFGVLFNGMQAHTLAVTLSSHTGLTSGSTALLLVGASAVMLWTGTRGIARLCQCLVPVMAVIWVGFSLWIVVANINKMPDLTRLIVSGAFGWQQATVGMLSYGLSQALTSGLQRGMFTAESGLGVSPNAAGLAIAKPHHPVHQGLIQMFGVIIDTLLLSTACAAMILFSGISLQLDQPTSGEQLLYRASELAPSVHSSVVIAGLLALCSWLSMLANYLYAESNLRFLVHHARPWVRFFKGLTLLVIVGGIVLPTPVLWQAAGLIVPVMVMLNVSALIMLSPLVRTLINDYYRQQRLGITPVFTPDKHPQLKGRLPSDIW